MENAEFHSSCYRSSDLNLAAGCERIVFRPLQDRVEPSTSDADIASAKERKRERILQQTSQRESVIIALHPHDPHEIRQHPYGRLRAIDLCLDRQFLAAGDCKSTAWHARQQRQRVASIAIFASANAYPTA